MPLAAEVTSTPVGDPKPTTQYATETQVTQAATYAIAAMSVANSARTTATTATTNIMTLSQLAADYQAQLQASLTDRQGLHAQADASTAGLAQEILDRKAGDATEATTRKAADDALAARATSLESRVTAAEALATATTAALTALTTRVANLEKLQVQVGMGVTTLPNVTLAAGATTAVTVTLSRNMGSTSYSVGYGMSGGTSLLGSLGIVGVASQTATTVALTVKNTGLASLVGLTAASVSVVAARDVSP